MAKIIIFGSGQIADNAYFYLTNDSPHEVVAFTVDESHMHAQEKFGLPIIPFEEMERSYPAGDFKMFVAVGWFTEFNKLRARKYEACKAKGYELISYVSSRAANLAGIEFGDNCFVLEFAVIQPCATIGSDVFIWSG